MRPIVINLNRDLPARARALAGGALAKVFGGCLPPGAWCSPYADACCTRCVKDAKAGAVCASV